MRSVSTLWRVAPLVLLLAGACKNEGEVSSPTTPTFEKTITVRGSQPNPVDIVELSDGNLFVLTNTTFPNAGKFLGIKLTATGDTIWTKGYGNTSRIRFAQQAVPTADGNVVVTGVDPQRYPNQLSVEKLDGATGAILWSRDLPPASATYGICRIARTASGGFLVLAAGEQRSTFVVYQLTATGELVSSVTHEGELPSDIRPTADGNYIVVGVNAPFLDNEPFLTKITPQGQALWSRRLLKNWLADKNTVTQLADGGYAIASNSAGDEAPIRILKTDALGQNPRHVFTSPAIKGEVHRLETGPDNSLILVGVQYGANGFGSPLYTRVSSSGSLLYPGSQSTVSGKATSLFKTANGSLLLGATENYKLVVKRTKADLTL